MDSSCQSCGNWKNFNHQPYGDQKHFGHPSLWRSKFFNHHKRGVCHMFLENPQPKTYDMPPFLAIKKIQLPSDNGGVSNGNWIFLVTQEGIGGIIFFSKLILHMHPPPPPSPFSMIKKIQSPSNMPPPSIGDQRISVTIRRCEYLGWRLNFFDHHLINP
jgi:hypothetical protein